VYGIELRGQVPDIWYLINLGSEVIVSIVGTRWYKWLTSSY
jgi:hypothetical protein